MACGRHEAETSRVPAPREMGDGRGGRAGAGAEGGGGGGGAAAQVPGQGHSSKPGSSSSSTPRGDGAIFNERFDFGVDLRVPHAQVRLNLKP